MYHEKLDSKEGWISLQWLKFRLVFYVTDEVISESCVEILEETIVPRLIWTAGLTSLDTSRGLWSSRLQKLTRLDSS